MKNIILTGITCILLLSCSGLKHDDYLAKDGKSDFIILVANPTDSLNAEAGQEIQQYIRQVTGANIPVVHQESTDNKMIKVGYESVQDSSLRQKLDDLPEDAFLISMDKNEIILSGKDGKSTLYAAYSFIEDVLGCRLLAPGELYIPVKNEIVLTKSDSVYKPAFAFRRILFPGRLDRQFRYWHKVEELDDWGMFVHTFQHLLPPEKYFQTHPEYFSLVGGRRLSDAQLCLGNPEVIRVLKENLALEMQIKPEKTYWSVSQNDCYNYCECDRCTALYDRFGSVSGAYVFMANQLAEEFPDKQISTLAYQFTRSAPKNIKPHENVNIMFCSIECNRSMPLEEDARSREFVQDMKDWSELTQNIFLWDYVVQFKNYLTPFPNFHVLQDNIRFFQKHHVNMMFQQGSGGNWSDLSDMKQYLIAKLLWNPELDTEQLRHEFLSQYYGPAAPQIESYYQLMHEKIKEHQKEEFLNIYGFPSDYFDSYLTPECLNSYRQMMDQAESAAASDSVILNRVWRTRLPVDFAFLDISLNRDTGSLSFFKWEGDKRLLNQEMLDYLDRFTERSIATHTTRINERNFQTDEYRRYVLNKLERMTRNNLAKKAQLNLLTQYSDTYPVGGVEALTDGLLGDLDFHNNWLGFQGHDMIVEIDLGKQTEITGVSANFLKAVNSWVFLPMEFRVEISPDGKTYHKAGSLKGDIFDRNYLVQSVPFHVNFEPVVTRYVRVSAISIKECPEWHRGFGNPSWIFIDELLIE